MDLFHLDPLKLEIW